MGFLSLGVSNFVKVCWRSRICPICDRNREREVLGMKKVGERRQLVREGREFVLVSRMRVFLPFLNFNVNYITIHVNYCY